MILNFPWKAWNNSIGFFAYLQVDVSANRSRNNFSYGHKLAWIVVGVVGWQADRGAPGDPVEVLVEEKSRLGLTPVVDALSQGRLWKPDLAGLPWVHACPQIDRVGRFLGEPQGSVGGWRVDIGRVQHRDWHHLKRKRNQIGTIDLLQIMET